MQVELIAIGNEILSGLTVNTNAAFLSAGLAELGLTPVRHRVVADEFAPLQAELADAIQRSQLVICCGGLGPTGDDRTRHAVAALLGCELVYRSEVAERLQARLGSDFPTLRDQATLPAAAQPLHNAVGTAPGLYFALEKATLIFLPGVPVELEPMFTDQVVPLLREKFPTEIPLGETLHFFGLPEATIDPVVQEQLRQQPAVSYGIYPSLGLVTVRLHAAREAESQLRTVKKGLYSAFGDHLFPSDVATLEEAVARECVHNGWSLSAAESCTGGAFAARLTRLPGASNYFLGSCVVYSNEMKQKLLNVPKGTLERHGAVSGETVREMVVRVVSLTGSQLGVAISGIAGPTGGTPEKPVGTVWVAATWKDSQPVVSRLQARGNRAAVIIRSVNYALAEIWKLIRNQI
jgi:nicotinamide-nucleotide amidase